MIKAAAADRVVLVGFGAIGGTVVKLLAARGRLHQIAAIALRDVARLRSDLPAGIPVLRDPADLSGIAADLVVEAAGRDSVAPWGRAALASGKSFAVSSTAALADTALFSELSELARANSAQLIIPPGALGGIDALAAAGRMGLDAVVHHITKPPLAWQGTLAESLCDLTRIDTAQTFFRGSARLAAAQFPQNANVAMVVAFAGLGPDHTQVSLTSDPACLVNRHEIVATGAFGRMQVQFENAALPENPKSSAMTALSLVRLIENRAAGISI